MKLNKKSFLTVFTTIGIKLFLGVNVAHAACENEIRKVCSHNNSTTQNNLCSSNSSVSEAEIASDIKSWQNNLVTYNQTKEEFRSSLRASQVEGLRNTMHENRPFITDYYQYQTCISEYAINNTPNISSTKQGNTNNSSSTQSPTAAQSNSPESYNLQVSQNNKQNYQAVQRAYEQTNAGKGKKHNKEANAIECMKNNPAQKTFKNTCNQAINFAYCFSGTAPGAKNENPQTLADLSCQNSQFGTLTIGAGESIPGSYKGLALDGLACKSPSQAVDMAFDRATNAATGRCSY